MLRMFSYLPPVAYTPEAYALASHLDQTGSIKLDLIPSGQGPVNPSRYDLEYVSMGYRPIWHGSKLPEVHDYASTSTGKHRWLKNAMKRHLSVRPIARSFLSPYVKADLGFGSNAPFVYRDMGVPERYFGAAQTALKSYDLFYGGSISESRQTDRLIAAALDSGMSILLAGEPELHIFNKYRSDPRVSFAGRVSRDTIPKLAKDCRFGVNFTPTIAPFDMQTSTKVLEYLAMGLPVISNDYHWVREFEASSGARMFKLGKDLDFRGARDFGYAIPDMRAYSWGNVFRTSGLEETILKSFYSSSH